MKRMIYILVLVLMICTVITGCSDSKDSKSEDDTGENVSNDKGSNDSKGKAKEKEKKDIYQIGETARTTSDSSGFSYSITVNSFKMTKDKTVEGISMEEKGYTKDKNNIEKVRFAVANVTIKNTSNESFVPNETISAQIEGDNMPSEDDLDDKSFRERDKELEPGEEITGNLVYLGSYFLDNKKLYLVYENESVRNEIKFELSVKYQQ